MPQKVIVYWVTLDQFNGFFNETFGDPIHDVGHNGSGQQNAEEGDDEAEMGAEEFVHCRVCAWGVKVVGFLEIRTRKRVRWITTDPKKWKSIVMF